MSERNFWNKKYREGGSSGRGSIGLYRNWKWNKIKESIGTDYNSLIDLGCGDLTFWNHPIAKKIMRQRIFEYTGLDISDEIITKNRIRFPNLKFFNWPAQIEFEMVHAQIVFCLDLLFHIMNEKDFNLILENACKYTSQFLVIYTWFKNPFKELNAVTDGKSQCFRNLADYDHVFRRNDMRRITYFKVPYDDYGMLYFFRRDLY